MAKRKIKKTGPSPQTAINFSGALREDVARLFGITGEAVSQWDCPRDKNGRYDLDKVVQWKLTKMEDNATPSDRAAKELEKISLQCKKLEAEIDERKKTTMTVEDHKTKVRELAQNFKNYFVEYGRLNLHELVGKDIDTLRKNWDELMRMGLKDFQERIK
jgi:hypothetical protein